MNRGRLIAATTAALCMMQLAAAMAQQPAGTEAPAAAPSSGTASLQPASPEKPFEELYQNPSLRTDDGSSVTLPSGVTIRDLVVGVGEEATAPKRCLLHYVFWLNSDKTYHQSTRMNLVPRPMETTVGSGTIPGFAYGITGMRVGGRRLVSIPPDLGYGRTGQGDVPGNATLHYDIELISIKKDASAASTGTTEKTDTATSAP